MNTQTTAMKILKIVRKEWASLIFLAVLATSFVIHVGNRNIHFQDADSTLVYYTITQFPRPSLSILAGYNKGSFISPALAEKIISSPIIAPFIGKYAKDINGNPISQQMTIQKLTGTSPLGLFRIALATALGALHIPTILKGLFGLPWGSTYSVGPGLIYGILLSGGVLFTDFMSRAIVLTQILFHLTVLLVFLAAIRIGLKRPAAALVGLLMLFSISLYSYGYHLGSTVWNYSSGALFLWLVAIYWSRPNKLKVISITTAILIFFNYLIIFYWVAFVLVELLLRTKENFGLKKVYRAALDVARSQWIAIVSLFVCAVIFFPVGESNRGNISLASVGSFFAGVESVILDVFSFYAKSGFWNLAQAIVFGIIVLASVWLLSRKVKRTMLTEPRDAVAAIVLFIMGLYLVSVFVGVLGFVPTRHILFIAPALYLGIAFLFDVILRKTTARSRSGRIVGGVALGIVFAAVIIVGFYCVSSNLVDTADASLTLPVTAADLAGVDQIVVDQYSWHIYYREQELGLQPELLKFDQLQEGKVYLYLGQNDPSYLLKTGQEESSPTFNPASIRLNILSEEKDDRPDVYFSPYITTDSVFHNSFFKIKFTITKTDGT